MLTNPPGASAPNSDFAIVFPDGLVGCPDWKRFLLLVDDEEDLPVAILRSLDDPQLELLITDPTLVDPDYTARLARHEPGAVAGRAVYCTLTIAQDGWITANLMGPLLIDPASREGRQVVLADAGYSTRHPVAQAGLAHAA